MKYYLLLSNCYHVASVRLGPLLDFLQQGAQYWAVLRTAVNDHRSTMNDRIPAVTAMCGKRDKMQSQRVNIGVGGCTQQLWRGLKCETVYT